MKNDYRTILVEIENNILKITLNRPDKRNAINETMVKELDEIFSEFKNRDEVIGVSLTGAGSTFCAGADLAYLKSLQDKSYQENLRDSINLKNMYWQIYNFPKPTLALINGPALAGGCGLMTVFDIAICSDHAIFAYPEVKIGFVASIVSVFLVQLVGFRLAKELLLTGKTINAVEAEKIGLINQVDSEGDLESVGDKIFMNIKNNSPQAIKQTKQLLQQQVKLNLESILEEACEFNAKSREMDDFKEGLNSFLEKRKPKWVNNST